MIEENGKIKTTRKELYNAVWNSPMTKMAMRLGMSDVGLAKVCKRHNIPTPYIGYWQQKKYGKENSRPELPNPDDDSPIVFQRSCSMIGQEDPELLEQITKLLEFETDENNKIVVPEELHDPHPIAIRMRARLKASRKYNPGVYESSCFPKTCVSWNTIPRATILVDSFMKALDQQGYLQGDEIVIFGESVYFGLKEILEPQLTKAAQKLIDEGQRKPKYNTYDYDQLPSGKLHISTTEFSYCTNGIQCNWKDGKHQRVENCLNQVLCGLIRSAAMKRERTIEREREELERKREEHRQEAIRRHQARKKARIEKLGDDLYHWQKSQELHVYLNEVRSRAEKKDGAIDPDSRFGKWMAWADDYAERIDPLLNGEAFRVQY